MSIDVLGVRVDSVTMDGALERALSFVDGTPHSVYTPNPEIIMAAQEDSELMQALKGASLVLPDGIGVVIASKILKNPLPERVPGFDFCCNLMKTGKSFYFFGSKLGIAQKAAEKMKSRGVNVVGYHHGYFDDDSEIIKDINEKKPDVVMVCLGLGKQEKWISRNMDKLNTSILIGAGGSLDVLADAVKRAPEVWQKMNLEWLYRVIKQPSRIPRIMVLPKFIIKVIAKKGQAK